MAKVLRNIVKFIGMVVFVTAILAIVEFNRLYQDCRGTYCTDTHFVQDSNNMAIIIHHTASDNPFTIAEIDDYHRREGYGGFAYHYFVTDTSICQVHQDTAATIHAASGFFNHNSIAVCLAGNFEERVPTAKEIKNLLLIVGYLQIKYRIPRNHIFTHGEVSKKGTACCGKYLKVLTDIYTK